MTKEQRMAAEQMVKELREYSSQRKGEIAGITRRAADMIENLSALVDAQDREPEEEYPER